MDIDESGWIIEFLLQQDALDDRSLNDMLSVLPLPNNNTRLKKRLIIRKIASDIEKGIISERTLEFLEQIEELDISEGNAEVSEAMKAAYCTLAMYCTAKFIEESAGDTLNKYPTAVKRIWSGRIREFEMSDVAKRVGLVEGDLKLWINNFEAGVVEVGVCENVVAQCKGVDVVEVLRRYVNETKEQMGPSFLESAFETVLSNRELSRLMGLDKGATHDTRKNKDRAPTVAANANNKSKGNESRGDILPKHKRIQQRGAKIVDPMETSRNIHDTIYTPEVNKVKKDLEMSLFELRAVVKDPLPEALRFAESLKATTSVDAPSSSRDKNDKVVEDNGDNVDQNIRPTFNIMERNSTAHTVEWNDSIDNSVKGSPTRPYLSSPKRRAVSPLSIYEINKLSRKRQKKKWTNFEEDTLRTGVQKYGKGNWKLILSMYRDIFVDRTEVDLKDKWRNLTR